MDIGFPKDFEKTIKQKLQDEFPSFKQSHTQPPPVSIRINPFKNKKFHQTPIPWTSYGYYLAERPVFTLDPTLHAGAYYVQEASSMFLEQAMVQHVNLNQSLTLLDLCAAPGGKSTHLASLINGDSLLVSNEVIRPRANILAENLQKWGTPNTVVTNNDPADFERLTSFFDVIVVDAPCSGEGLFRKDNNAIKEWSSDNVLQCAQRQRRILNNIWPSLKENGILIYSTCTFNELENEDNLATLQQACNVEFLSLQFPPEWGIEQVEKGKVIGYRFYPHKLQGEGFFLSVLRKKEVAREDRIKKNKNSFGIPSKKILEEIKPWLRNPDSQTIIQRNDLIQFFPSSKSSEIEILSQTLRLILAGTFIATVKHNKIIPEHSLALSTEIDQDIFNILALDLESALRYLRKEVVINETNQRGFVLVTHQSLPLGWVNALPNRLNNMYPAEWRIRMS